MFLTIIFFLIILGILVFVHEFGHFIVAKRAGIRVDEFGIGFPPKIFSFKKGETEYSLNLFPLGGFVKIFGEDANEEEIKEIKSKFGEEELKRSFVSKSPGIKAKIVVAGVLMNFLLAAVLFSLGFVYGLPAIADNFKKTAESPNIFWGFFEEFNNVLDKTAVLSDQKIQIIAVAANSPAEKAGIKMGDTIASLKIKNQNSPPKADPPWAEKIKIEKVGEAQEFIKNNAGEEIVLTLIRGNELLDIKVIPRENPPEGEGALGIVLDKVAMVSYPFYIAPIKGVETTITMSLMFVGGYYEIIKDLIVGKKITAEIVGPIGIAGLTNQMVNLGFIYLIQFAAILSLNLALINIFPFPALDGGRLVFLAFEKIKGSPLSLSWEKAIHAVGFAILILLMIIITVKDVMRLF